MGCLPSESGRQLLCFLELNSLYGIQCCNNGTRCNEGLAPKILSEPFRDEGGWDEENIPIQTIKEINSHINVILKTC